MEKKEVTNTAAELNDDVLENVNGGTELKVPTVGDKTIETCDDFICVWCKLGKTAGQSGHHCEPQGGTLYPDISWFDYTCSNCLKEHSCPLAHRRLGICTGN